MGHKRIACVVFWLGCGTDCPSDFHPPCGDQTILTQDAAKLVVAQNGTGAATRGYLDPENGENWYTYTASAGFFEHVEPEVYLHSAEPVEVCVYMDCAASCPPGTTDATAPNGAQGCCATGTYEHFQIFGCTNSDVNVWFSASLSHATACNACLGYEVDYNW